MKKNPCHFGKEKISTSDDWSVLLYRELKEEQLIVLKCNARFSKFWLVDIELLFERGRTVSKYVVC